MTFQEHLKNKILTLCAEKGLSVNKLATLSGLTQSTVDGILKGRSNNPRIKTMKKLSMGFGIDFADLISYIFDDAYEFDDDD